MFIKAKRGTEVGKWMNRETESLVLHAVNSGQCNMTVISETFRVPTMDEVENN